MTKLPADDASPDTGIPCVIYSAKSSDDHRGSIRTQIADCRAAIGREGDRYVAGVFHDEGISGYKRSRGPGLERAKAATTDLVERHGAAELWGFHSSRFGRGTGLKDGARALGKLFYEMRERGVVLRTVEDDEFVTNEMLIGFASRQASKYSEDIGAHVRRGLRAKHERGERLGGPVPDGYVRLASLDAYGERVIRYEIDPSRAPIFERAFELAAGGMGDPSIARMLNAEGHRTKAGALWRRRRVQDFLTNPHYAGRVAINRGAPSERVAVGSHPALVAPEVFDRVQAMRRERDRAAGSNRRRQRPSRRYALANLARCARCGGTMYAVTSTYQRKDGSRARRYVCSHYKEATGGCDAMPIDAELVDRAIVTHLRGFFVDFDDWLGHVSGRREAERTRIADAFERNRAELARLERLAAKVEADYLRQVDAGNEDAAAMAARGSRRVAEEREQALVRLSALDEALAAFDAERPIDAMLDFYNRLSAAVRGRLADDASLADVNAKLIELLEGVSLEATAHGIRIDPWLREDVAACFVRDSPCDGVSRWGRIYHVGSIDPEPIATLATGEERIVPPVDGLLVPERGGADSQL